MILSAPSKLDPVASKAITTDIKMKEMEDKNTASEKQKVIQMKFEGTIAFVALGIKNCFFFFLLSLIRSKIVKHLMIHIWFFFCLFFADEYI